MNNETLRLLGEFLRRKREAISPESIGLVKPLRTRTPGLRREDVAMLANISSVWYSKIERGKVEGISVDTLQTLIDVLQLTEPEIQYVHKLMTKTQASKVLSPCMSSSTYTNRILVQINPLPAIVINDYFDIIRSNQAFVHLCGFDINTLPDAERNYIFLTITHKKWQTFLRVTNQEEREIGLTRMAGLLRGNLAARPNDTHMKELIQHFNSISPIFAKGWRSNSIQAPHQRLITFNHAELGKPMIFDKQIWCNTSGESSGRLNVYHPRDDDDYQLLADII